MTLYFISSFVRLISHNIFTSSGYEHSVIVIVLQWGLKCLSNETATTISFAILKTWPKKDLGGLSMNSMVYFDICLKRQYVQISD